MPADYWDLHHHPPHLNPRDYLSPWGQDLPHHIHPPGAIICPPGMGCTPLACTSAPQGLLSAPCLPLLLLLSLLPTLTGGCVQCPPGRRGLAGRFARLCTRYEAGREGRACSKYPWVGQTLRGFALEDQAVEVVTEKIHRVFRLMELGHNLSDLPVFWDWLHEVKLPEFTRDAPLFHLSHPPHSAVPSSLPGHSLGPQLLHLPEGQGALLGPGELLFRLGESPAPTASDRGRLCRLLRTGIGQLHPGVSAGDRAGLGAGGAGHIGGGHAVAALIDSFLPRFRFRPEQGAQ
ncbi:transmembrane protein 95 isoform X3 [Alligator sinensis]|uniref:Transmembrane protein 95 isoform X3 n=1 Tax=Alligator sinensis TaxID=38654 RepID=A0A3Q0FQH6_ALLSI|nr:transmembrane protein 95 isoform X3 [Alligator sinensis]